MSLSFGIVLVAEYPSVEIDPGVRYLMVSFFGKRHGGVVSSVAASLLVYNVRAQEIATTQKL